MKDKTVIDKEDMGCKFSNCLYALIYNGWQELFIGQTSDILRNKITVHNQQIRDISTRVVPVSPHLHSCCKTNVKFFFPFFKCKLK